MKTELEHSREAVNHLRTFAQQARWERCAHHCLAMQQRFALCCEPTFLYGLDYPEVTALMELWLYWAALQDLYALPGVCGGGAFAAACAKLSAFLDESEAEEQRRKAAVTWRVLGGQ